MKTKILSLAVILLSALYSNAALADTGTVLTWETPNGNWKACGPVQCLWSTQETERDAIDMVINDDRHTTRYIGHYGKCSRYRVSNMRSWDDSTEKVIRDAKCDDY